MLAMNHNFSWAPNTSSKNLFILGVPYQKVPLFDVSRTCACPSELFLCIMESKVANLIFNIVSHQILTYFFNHCIIIDIKFIPLEPWWQWHGLWRNIFFLEFLDLTLWDLLLKLHNWLTVPELVLAQDADKLLESISLEKVNVWVI